ncbi:hypothetical protein K474DRAFT_1704380 [Panus rudis PR-1116 ss-1]|nr:hypothetical protein K474DRAFT_1704380 [Panus rudis PR-1116 ss-1]
MPAIRRPYTRLPFRKRTKGCKVEVVPTASIADACAQYDAAWLDRKEIRQGVYMCPVCDVDYVSGSIERHLKAHFQLRDRKCPHYIGSIKCDFTTNDPALLTRHRKEEHNHVPKERTPKGTSRPPRKRSRGKTSGRRKPYDADTEDHRAHIRLSAPPPSPFSDSSPSTPSLTPSTSSNSPASTDYSFEEEYMDKADFEGTSSSLSDPHHDVLELLEAYNDHAIGPTPTQPPVGTWSDDGVYAATPESYHLVPSNSLGACQTFDPANAYNSSYLPIHNAYACPPQVDTVAAPPYNSAWPRFGHESAINSTNHYSYDERSSASPAASDFFAQQPIQQDSVPQASSLSAAFPPTTEQCMPADASQSSDGVLYNDAASFLKAFTQDLCASGPSYQYLF